MHDQADDLRQLVRQSARGSAAGPAPGLIVVGGGQSGVGATTAAVNLAVGLARQARRTVLVDADLNRGDVAGLCSAPDRNSVVDVIRGRRTVHEVLEPGPAGIQVLPGAWAPADVAECTADAQQQFVAQLRALGHHADVIVVDIGSSRNSFARRFWRAADLVLLVTTPEPASIMDSYASIKVLLGENATTPVHTLVNFTPFAPMAADVHARINQACRRFLGFSTHAAGYLPKEDAVSDAATSGRPFLIRSPRSEAARSIERLAETLWTQARGARTRGHARPANEEAA